MNSNPPTPVNYKCRTQLSQNELAALSAAKPEVAESNVRLVAIGVKETDLARFWSKVDFNGPIVREGLTNCWLWTSRAGSNGYGSFKQTRSHRFISGAKDSTRFACHHCDNRLCVRPTHIFIGTQLENVRDCISKGRFHFTEIKKYGHLRKDYQRGEGHVSSKLTKEQAMMALACARGSVSAMAKDFGVTPGLLHNIRRGRNWKHLQRTNPNESTNI